MGSQHFDYRGRRGRHQNTIHDCCCMSDRYYLRQLEEESLAINRVETTHCSKHISAALKEHAAGGRDETVAVVEGEITRKLIIIVNALQLRSNTSDPLYCDSLLQENSLEIFNQFVKKRHAGAYKMQTFSSLKLQRETE